MGLRLWKLFLLFPSVRRKRVYSHHFCGRMETNIHEQYVLSFCFFYVFGTFLEEFAFNQSFAEEKQERRLFRFSYHLQKISQKHEFFTSYREICGLESFYTQEEFQL